MRLFGLMFAVTALAVTFQVYAPPLRTATGPGSNVDVHCNPLWLNAAVAAPRSAASSMSLGGTEVTLIGDWDGFGGSYADVWGDGDFAYIGHFGDSAVNIVDITDPANPIGMEYVLPPPNTFASAQDVKVGDGLLFIALEGDGASVHIVDVRDPGNPVGLVDIDISGLTAIHNVF